MYGYLHRITWIHSDYEICVFVLRSSATFMLIHIRLVQEQMRKKHPKALLRNVCHIC